MKDDWIIRNAVGGDLAFIYSTWSHSYRYGSHIGKSCRNSIFFEHYHRVIDGILSQPDTRVRLAVKPDEPDVIFGYLVSQPHIAHYAFTKELLSQLGIARSLFEDADSVKFYTHKTFIIQKILEKHPDRIIYNPFLLFHKGGHPNGSYKYTPKNNIAIQDIS